MVNENKSNVIAAAAGIVVGAGAVLAGAAVLADKNNQRKLSEVIAKGQSLARNYAKDVNEKAQVTREVVNKTVDAGKVKAKKLVAVVKTAEKGVKNI